MGQVIHQKEFSKHHILQTKNKVTHGAIQHSISFGCKMRIAALLFASMVFVVFFSQSFAAPAAEAQPEAMADPHANPGILSSIGKGIVGAVNGAAAAMG